MKQYITIITLLIICCFRSQAQTNVSIHAGEKPLETLLTEEQKKSVTHLTITGTLLDEDYAFIRSTLLNRLKELNLRDADIDTIPEHAFDYDCDLYADGYAYHKTILLPAKVKYLSDNSLSMCNTRPTYIISGEYPNLGRDIYFHNDHNYWDSNIRILPSADNQFLKMEDNCVCSADGKTLYFINNKEETLYSKLNVDRIPSGIKTIYKNAFENRYLYFYYLEIPETVDSIGDRAFSNIYYDPEAMDASPSKYDMGYIIWKSKTPPRLGNRVWRDNDFLDKLAVYVPDESINIYKNTEEWNLIPHYFKSSSFDVTNIKANIKAGDKPLETLLTDTQKKNVTHLTITGTLLNEDYAFIRSTLLDRLKELNMKDADIDTIPKHAFEFKQKDLDFHDIQIVLPKTLKSISDYAFHSENSKCFKVVLTGAFPSLGQKWNSGVDSFKPSEDNTHCFYCADCEGIYSSDKKILFYYRVGNVHEGTKIIGGRAFHNTVVQSFMIPESVDSIGDYAFQNAIMAYIVGVNYSQPIAYCEAKIPPRLGNDVFLDNEIFVFHVPDESVELYKNTEGWNVLYIAPISSDIQTMSQSKTISVTFEDRHCMLKHESKTISNITVYNTGGQRIWTKDANANKASIPKQVLVSPYSLLNIHYTDGTVETIKLKP
ncbi:leucine-rich repeat protein [Xylanibacter muris]|uniref:Leucine-rich repeat protein n=1 Tax=Xylanibacter muris TaxID=2736290 RepID=A0ABX2AQQ9_9BACT|nr:leucine-rich repeat protein [Xylanibacter muris]NPD93045.1 leucine-rich repeat protein [Xylanibacter muris]